jgi:hypothetical protein
VLTQVLAAGASDCERIHDGFLDQPVGTVSALAYIVVGVWIASRFRRPAGRAFGLFAVFAGIGSIGFHGWDDPGVNFVHDLAFPGALVFIAGFELVHSGVISGRRIQRRGAGYLVGVAAFTVGLIVRLLGQTDGPLCAPGSLLQWHAAWHIATAVALGAWAWAALAQGEQGEEMGWGDSTARPRSSPAPARESAEG